MKEYLVVFAQMLAVAWLLKTLAQARGNPDKEELGWFDIRLGSKPGKTPPPPKPPGPNVSPAGPKPPAPRAAGPDRPRGRGPHA